MNKTHRMFILATAVAAIWGSAPFAGAVPAAAKIYDDDVVGAEVELQPDWQVKPDPVLLETHGFAIYAATSKEGKALTGHARDAIARVAIAYKAKGKRLEDMVATKMEQYKQNHPKRSDIVIAGGVKAVAITGLPGTEPYSVVYAKHGNQIYEIGLWSDSGGIDARGQSLLAKLKFKEPQRGVEALNLEDATAAAHRRPPMDKQIINANAEAARRDQVQGAVQRGELPAHPTVEAMALPRDNMLTMMSSTAQASGGTCGFSAPTSLYWQLQWDGSNTFYSGTYYSLKSNPGWSAMSGNYGSWWGTNYHVGLCYTDYANQYYANDWPAQYWANAYAAFSGYVEWAGWGTDGFYTLGNYVVVRNGYYRNVTAHLSGIADGIYWGAYVDGYYKVIGWVGSTGGDWDPHIHARVSWGESLTYNGQPYGGQSVAPTRLRCFTCKDQDLTTSNGARYYTSYYHGKWMKY